MTLQIGTTGDDRFEALAGDDAVDGGPGFDSISYAASAARVCVDLAAGRAAALGEAPGVPLRLMPLGDSLTRGGVTSRDPHYALGGGYRTELWKTFRAEGAAVDFVGSAAAGPEELGDPDHEGHGGRTIDWLAARVEGWLDAAVPDAVLLMAGTNDARANPSRPADPPEAMAREMAGLIDRIALRDGAPAVFVATLPPIDPAGNGGRAATRAEEYDALLAAVVAERQARGLDVTLVDASARLDLGDVSDPPADSGVHLTPGGYAKVAAAWHEALDAAGLLPRPAPVETDALAGIEAVEGTAFGDGLAGGAGGDRLAGLDGDDWILGREGDDALLGGAGADGIFGGDGADWIEGGEGDDALHGEGGADLLVGGAGADTFVLRRGEAEGDRIADFTPGEDRLRLDGFGREVELTRDGDLWRVEHSRGAETFLMGGVPQGSPVDFFLV